MRVDWSRDGDDSSEVINLHFFEVGFTSGRLYDIGDFLMWEVFYGQCLGGLEW